MAEDRACLLAIDQGTTSSRAIVFSLKGDVVATSQQEFAQIFPRPGWVEHDPEVIWATTLATARKALADAEARGWSPVAAGVTNQRETAIIWDRKSGRPIHNAIVWQDRRTAPQCRALAEAGHGDAVLQKTGLVLDPYFSATKYAWILDQVPGARARAERGELAFGTVDSFLIWRLTGGQRHLTDATNASRTSLYALEDARWDESLLELFNVPESGLPEVCDCAAEFGMVDEALLGRALPITGVAGDQQAAAIGQACFLPGEMKSTYGTGAFLLLNTGETMTRSASRLLSTVAYRLDGKTTFAMEGSVLSAGATIQWIRDGLGLIARAPEINALAEAASDDSGVYLVPAFSGLGAPHWDPDARGAIVGLSRESGRAEIAQAALESTAYQTWDLLDAMAGDAIETRTLRVDGGMAANDRFLQRLADLCGVETVRPVNTETTAWGAAFLAGLGAGLYESLEEGRALWRADRTFSPCMPESERNRKRAGWRAAVRQVSAGGG
ncbi:MAG: glycerol kinase GlpK [Euryhalocaulis sp.]|uniref:glycerol kinase GlpK n=1 Tax=Euryhalocaulis sp. TaxID=2744307 RepID=UPI0017FA681B|nr:glycerol kinase GlpK [Euryhalocaulis sp.]MBA4802200.1 glycerol kinase GlpK [Euryhalocaulis sp.]